MLVCQLAPQILWMKIKLWPVWSMCCGVLSLFPFSPKEEVQTPRSIRLDHTTTCGSYTSLEGRSQAEPTIIWVLWRHASKHYFELILSWIETPTVQDHRRVPNPSLLSDQCKDTKWLLNNNLAGATPPKPLLYMLRVKTGTCSSLIAVQQRTRWLWFN